MTGYLGTVPVGILLVGACAEIEWAAPVHTCMMHTSLDRLDAGVAPIAVVVLDADTYGLGALAALGASPRLAGVPVLALTSDEEEAVQRALRADDVLLRPIRPRDLARRLRLLVELGRARIALSFGGQASEEGPLRVPYMDRVPWLGGDEPEVTALVHAQAEVGRLNDLLVERQTFDRAILDGVEVGIVTTDDAGRVTFLNRAARELLCEDGEAAGRDVRDLLKLEIGPDALLGAEARKRWAYTLEQDDRRDLDLDLSVSRAEGEHRRVGFFFIFRDLTLEKQQENERRRFEHLAAMGTMVAGFAHEVRNPVASLRALTESLNDELLEANLPLPHIGRMLKVLERVDRLVRTSLQFGRPAAPKRARHRPWALLNAATTALEPRPGRRASELRVEVEPELPDVFVDDQQIAQVLVILLSNALDATGSARRVLLRAVSARPGEGEARPRKSQPPPGPPQVRIEVSDDGPGIAPEIIGRIFDPFFTTKPSGTGLGLSIAQQLTSENGGRMEVVSTRGELTTFTVCLPTQSALSLYAAVAGR